LAWYFGGVLILGLGIMSASCSLIEPPVPSLPVATIVPPFIPHSLEGRADCRVCHATGIAGAPQFPADHSQRPSDVCQTCHRTAPGIPGDNTAMPMPVPPVTTTPPVTETTAIDAGKIYSTKCAACHGANRQGTTGLAPPLTAASLAAKSDTEMKGVIADGKTGTAMPAFKGAISPEEIGALLKFLKE